MAPEEIPIVGNKKNLLRILEMQYEKFSAEFGYDKADILDGYRKRLKKANEKNISLSIFYRAEMEALDLFRKKILAIRERELRLASQDSYARTSASESGASEKKKATMRFSSYPQKSIHEDAPNEVEHLFGCMEEMRATVMPPMMESVNFIRDKSFKFLVYKVESLFDDIAGDAMSDPLVISNYRQKLKNSKGKKELIDRASFEVYKVVINLFKQLKKAVEWMQHPKARYSTDLEVNYKGNPISIADFAYQVNKDCNEVLKVFGLDRF